MTHPITVIIRITNVVHNVDTRLNELAVLLHNVKLSGIISCRSKRSRYSSRSKVGHGVREVHVRSDGLLDLGLVEIRNPAGVRERIRHQLPQVILVSARDGVIDVFHFVVAEVVGGGADLVDSASVAVEQLVKAVAFSIQ